MNVSKVPSRHFFVVLRVLFYISFYQVFSFISGPLQWFPLSGFLWSLGFLKLILMQQLTDVISDEESFEIDGDGGWPFQTFVEQLLVDMFDPGK